MGKLPASKQKPLADLKERQNVDGKSLPRRFSTHDPVARYHPVIFPYFLVDTKLVETPAISKPMDKGTDVLSKSLEVKLHPVGPLMVLCREVILHGHLALGHQFMESTLQEACASMRHKRLLLVSWKPFL